MKTDLSRRLRPLAFAVVALALSFVALIAVPVQSQSSPALVDVKVFGGRNNSTPMGYVVLDSEPATEVTVELASSHERVWVTPSVTIGPACSGCSPAVMEAFHLYIKCDSSPTTVTISATFNGVTQSTTINVSAKTDTLCGVVLDPADTVHVADDGARYSNDQLEVRATSTSATANLFVFTYVDTPAHEDPYIGMLENKGDGRYEGKFYWPD